MPKSLFYYSFPLKLCIVHTCNRVYNPISLVPICLDNKNLKNYVSKTYRDQLLTVVSAYSTGNAYRFFMHATYLTCLYENKYFMVPICFDQKYVFLKKYMYLYLEFIGTTKLHFS